LLLFSLLLSLAIVWLHLSKQPNLLIQKQHNSFVKLQSLANGNYANLWHRNQRIALGISR
jgi:hypothetical protein